MAQLFWKHGIKLEVAGLNIEHPKIKFMIRREADPTPPSGYVEVYNLNTDTENQIYERGQSLVLSGGYNDNLSLIFSGAVQRVERERRDLSRITRLKIAGAVQEKKRKEKEKTDTTIRTVRAYAGEVSLRDIVRDIVVEDMKLILGPLDDIPADAKIKDFDYEWASEWALNLVLRQHKITWYEEDGTIRFNSPGKPQPDGETVELSKESGLLDSPVVTDEGIRVRSLLRPDLRLGGVIDLKSDAISGKQKIIAVQHFGSNWTDSFITDCECRTL